MNVEMRFWMETEDDDESLTEKQWKKELDNIVEDVCEYMNKKHKTYIKDVDGEFTTESEGEFKFVLKKEQDAKSD